MGYGQLASTGVSTLAYAGIGIALVAGGWALRIANKWRNR